MQMQNFLCLYAKFSVFIRESISKEMNDDNVGPASLRLVSSLQKIPVFSIQCFFNLFISKEVLKVDRCVGIVVLVRDK